MVNQEQSIPCPTCQNKIPFDAQQLLMGARFVCTNCGGAIGLAEESKPLVSETMQKFDELKSGAVKMDEEK